ncbi:MAG: 2-hydroxychromene-2-carboxylate isomerase [Ruegeria sp.]
MSQSIEFIYDFGSPNSYLAHKVLPDLAARCGVGLLYSPALLGGVFKATNNQSPITAFAHVRHKLTYQMYEMHRFAKRHGLTFHMNPHFPVMTLALMRGAIFARGKPWESKYTDAVFDAIWVHGQKMDDPGVIRDVLQEHGLPADAIGAAVQSSGVKQALKDATDAAVERGAFGAPTMFVGDEMFFGKDSLTELEFELQQLCVTA